MEASLTIEWINVEDGLPQEAGNYLIYDWDNENIYIASWWDERWEYPFADIVFDAVTHWAHLPKTPFCI